MVKKNQSRKSCDKKKFKSKYKGRKVSKTSGKGKKHRIDRRGFINERLELAMIPKKSLRGLNIYFDESFGMIFVAVLPQIL